jgi:hypothetical protein
MLLKSLTEHQIVVTGHLSWRIGQQEWLTRMVMPDHATVIVELWCVHDILEIVEIWSVNIMKIRRFAFMLAWVVQHSLYGWA